MEQSVVEELQNTYGPVKWLPGQVAGYPGEGWFLLEINPLPPSREEALLVAADIIEDRYGMVLNGKVRHNPGCAEEHVIPDQLKLIGKVIKQLKPISYRVMIHPGNDKYLFGQPLAIAIDPMINYELFPDHPHLNMGTIMSSGYHMPDSFCYSTDIAREFVDPVERYKHAFARITIWIFRHMIWEESRKIYGRGVWIGPEEGLGLQPIDFLYNLNPEGPCRCRSGRSYRDCHFRAHLNHQRAPLTREVTIQVFNTIMTQTNLWREKKRRRDLFYNELRNH